MISWTPWVLVNCSDFSCFVFVFVSSFLLYTPMYLMSVFNFFFFNFIIFIYQNKSFLGFPHHYGLCVAMERLIRNLDKLNALSESLMMSFPARGLVGNDAPWCSIDVCHLINLVYTLLHACASHMYVLKTNEIGIYDKCFNVIL